MDKETEREVRQTKKDRQKDRLHPMNSAVTSFPPPSPPQLPVTHGWWQPPSCLCLRHLNHTRTWYCHHTLSSISNQYTAMCVCVCICVSLIGYVTPCWGEECECVQMPDCVSTIWQASLLEKSLSDCRSIWQAPILKKAYGLGRANKYTPRKSRLLTPGQRKLRSKGRIEYKSKSVMWYSSSYKHSQLPGWCTIQETWIEWLVLIQEVFFPHVMCSLSMFYGLAFKHQTVFYWGKCQNEHIFFKIHFLFQPKVIYIFGTYGIP